MVGIEEWFEALDRTVLRLLAQAGIDAPPVDAFQMAERLQLAVYIDKELPARGCRKQLPETTVILLGEDDREERFQFALAHEIGEQFAAEVFERVGLDIEGVSPRLCEDVANRLASRVLCPSDWFFSDAIRLDGDLLELKGIYSTASHEVIACRMLDLKAPTVVTIFDQGCLARRTANFSNCPRLQPIERQCQETCHERGEPVERGDGRLRVQSWPVHEDGWKREVLRTTAAIDE